jgi:hypothetical protein
MFRRASLVVATVAAVASSVVCAPVRSVAVADDAAADGPRVSPDVEAAAARLGLHPTQEVVRRGHELAVRSDEASATRWIGALWHARGPAASWGLVAMTGHDAPAVRVLALDGVARAGLRADATIRAVRRMLRDDDKAVRIAALRALGRVGDAGDVDDLLAAAAAKDPDVRTAGFRGLEALTGQAIRRDVTLWEEWWAEAQPSTAAALAAAIDRAASGDADVRAGARREVARTAWIDVPLVTRTARTWIRSSEPEVRADGFHLFAAARLAEEATEVAGGLRYERHPETWDAAFAAAEALGLSTEGTKRPDAYVPDRRFDRDPVGEK